MTMDYNILEFNTEAEKIFDLNRVKVVGKNFVTDILPKSQRSDFEEKLHQVIDGDSVKNHINCTVRGNGKKQVISWNLDKLFDTENNIIGIVANGRDITEREKTMEAMKESEEKYRQLFDNMISGFALHEIITDKDGKPDDYIFLDLNEAFENLTGLKKKNVVGTRIKDLMPNIEPEFIERYGKVALTGEPIQFEEYAGALNRYYQIKSYSPEKGKFAVIFDEITAQKIAEQERQKLNMKLIEKNEELEQIIYVTSHDLRSPLVNIQGFGNELEHSVNEITKIVQKDELYVELKEKILDIVDTDILPSLKFISGSASKMDSLLAGLLRLSRIGRISLNVKKLDMNKLINEVINEFEYRLKESNVKVRIGDLPNCLGDELQINQVFSNLLDNSIKCLDPERPGEIEFSGRIENGYAVYSVKDNGIGMNKAHQKNIFDIFHRLDPDKNSGEGLGLTIVRKILIRHNGKVEVESEQGKGSTFNVFIPVSVVKRKNREE
jgi:PAS domain S-box-containing protein